MGGQQTHASVRFRASSWRMVPRWLRLACVGFLAGCADPVKPTTIPPATIQVERFGILTVTSDCMVEYCGPKYKLWNEDFSGYVALRGRVSDWGDQRLVHIRGHWTTLAEAERSPAESPVPSAIHVDYSRTISSYPYHEHLVADVHRYTRERYGCDIVWDKTFGWGFVGERPELLVRLTNTFSAENPLPFLEVRYDVVTGAPIRELNNLGGRSPCP